MTTETTFPVVPGDQITVKCPDGFNNETRVDITVMSYDEENEPDVLAALGASFALMISDIPFDVPIATVRVGRVDNNFIINPTRDQMSVSDMEIVVSGNERSGCGGKEGID